MKAILTIEQLKELLKQPINVTFNGLHCWEVDSANDNHILITETDDFSFNPGDTLILYIENYDHVRKHYDFSVLGDA